MAGPPATASARAEERVPDWLLGGKVRRRVLERLVDEEGWSANVLASSLRANRAWVFEIYRGLKDLDALERVCDNRYRLSDASEVAVALKALLVAAAPYERRKVDRPQGRIRPATRRRGQGGAPSSGVRRESARSATSGPGR